MAIHKNTPVGAPVVYSAVIGGRQTTVSRTRSEPWQLPSGHWVVMIEGKTGCVALDALEKAGPA